MIKLNSKYLLEGVHFLSERKSEFEQKYLQVREKENRIYKDEEVKLLPDIKNTHQHYNEWILRKKSLDRFLRYLSDKQKELMILDVGCGNGWFSYKISKAADNQIFAVDINEFELKQAARVFSSQTLSFVYGDVFENIFSKREFDLIVLNSSIQYFPDLLKIIDVLLALLKEKGELHIIDSPFYNEKEIDKAKVRTKEYYVSIGFPEMAGHYHHHSYEELFVYDCDILYNPRKVFNRIKRLIKIPDSPFPWIRIKKTQ